MFQDGNGGNQNLLAQAPECGGAEHHKTQDTRRDIGRTQAGHHLETEKFRMLPCNSNVRRAFGPGARQIALHVALVMMKPASIWRIEEFRTGPHETVAQFVVFAAFQAIVEAPNPVEQRLVER